MISYELAKQLKEAGYPQTSKDGRWNLAPYIYPVGLNSGGVHAPTLSELIEACGEGIYSLRRTYEKDNWVAHGYDIPNRDIEQIQYQASGQKGFIGSTPEEAVANLWLALNKK